MQCWCHGWPIEIFEYHMPDRDGMAEAFQAHVKQLHCQMVLKLLKQKRRFHQPQIDLVADAHSDFGLMIQVDISHSMLSYTETQTSLVLEQLCSHAAPAHDIFAPGGMLSLFFFDGERVDLKSAYYWSVFGWLRRLISGKDQQKKPRPGERKPEQRKLPTRREGGRGPREPREPDAWE